MLISVLKTFFSFIGQSKSDEADRKWGEREGHDMQQRLPAGVKPAMLQL